MLFAALAVVTAAYLNAIHGPFVWDDQLLIVDPGVAHRLSLSAHLSGAFWHASEAVKGDSSYYRPVTTLSFAVDSLRAGGSPGAFHATNLLLHLVACALVFALARRLGAGALGAALAAALFGVFPRTTESVAWISGRTDVIATVLALSALLLHGEGRAGPARRIAAAACLFLGLLGKEVAAAGLAGIAALEVAAVLRREKRWARAVADLAPVLVAVAGYTALRIHALAGAPTQPIPSIPNASWMPLQALGRYVLMVLDPRPRLVIGTFGLVEPAVVALGVLAVIALAAGLVRAVRRPPRPLAAALGVAAVAALVLVLHLRRLPINYVAADRFLYLPLAALAALAAGAAAVVGPAARRAALAAALLALAVYTPLTVLRNEDWNDPIRLWTRAVETASPEQPLPMHELGNALADAGRYDDAIRAFRVSLRHATGDFRITALGNLSGVLSDIGRLDEARAVLREMIALDPDRPANHYNLGVVDVRLLDFEGAREAFRAALARMPTYDDARRALATIGAYERAWQGLPPERADEPTDVHVRRARFWTMLGLRARASALWIDVAARDDATQVDVEQATAYLVTNGEPADAGRVLDRARASGVAAARLDAFEAVLKDRIARRARRTNAT
jgi:tetratricopeptide (TPR) repeat protein